MPPIIYEDDDILVINKPAGVPVHSDEHYNKGTILDDVRKQYPEAELAHRLDKDTSGVLLIAKNKKVHEFLKKQFQERTIKKTYIALVVGRMTQSEGVINLPITRSKKDFRKRVATPRPDEKAREAITEYEALKRYEEFTLLKVFPHTGRTHQIRSHLSSLGTPVTCDNLYGGKRFVCPEGLTHHFLHAEELEFVVPGGKTVHASAPLPADLHTVLLHLAILPST